MCLVEKLPWSHNFVWIRSLRTGSCCKTIKLLSFPHPSHALFPWKVEKKCHSAGTLKSWCNVRLRKFFQFLYWVAEPSEKWIFFFSDWLILSLRKVIECCWIRWTATVSCFRQSEITIKFSWVTSAEMLRLK
jgi:hypothetical protein